MAIGELKNLNHGGCELVALPLYNFRFETTWPRMFSAFSDIVIFATLGINIAEK